MKCWHCGHDLIWGGDHDIDDDGDDFPLRGEGIVTNLSCSNDECNTHVEVYHYYNPVSYTHLTLPTKRIV